jgi:hypothetical protein
MTQPSTPACRPHPTHATASGAGRSSSIGELEAETAHAERRLALYRRRIYLGRGDAGRLRELERMAHGAADRLQRARRDERARP